MNFMATQTRRISRGWWTGRLAAFWRRMLRASRREAKRLRLLESLPMGERRFVAVVEFERERFLLGGTAGSLVLLARLGMARGMDVDVESAEDSSGECAIGEEETVQSRLNALWSGGGGRTSTNDDGDRGVAWGGF
jgi:flagellar biogenesis protein FliO